MHFIEFIIYLIYNISITRVIRDYIIYYEQVKLTRIINHIIRIVDSLPIVFTKKVHKA